MLKKEEIRKEVKERLSYKTISPVWKKIFSISGLIFSVGAGVLTSGLALPSGLLLGVKITTATSGVLAAGSYLDKSKGGNESIKNNIVTNTVRKILQIIK
jgi:hypothetical protein